MENNFQNEERYHKARKKVEEIKGFHGHLLAFIVINAGLFLFNIITFPNQLWFDYWFYWQVLIWAIGVVIHGLKVFNYIPFFNKNWEEQKIKQFMAKDELSKTTWE
ncbi:2TM domain-containing protein [Flavobacterium restrictum]|nr:2TM domain-containing protein [Flavobacterium restrictum]